MAVGPHLEYLKLLNNMCRYPPHPFLGYLSYPNPQRKTLTDDILHVVWHTNYCISKIWIDCKKSKIFLVAQG